MSKTISLANICKNYISAKRNVQVLTNLNAEFEANKFYVIMGHSGSGKSSLINGLGLIDTFDKGVYELDGKNVQNLKDRELAQLRMSYIGFIFQDFQLNETLTAIENVILPMIINQEINKKNRYDIACKYLSMVGLKERLSHFPRELSGGEQQRVAIARALANNPSIILADEPTGNLDEKVEKEILSILKDLSKSGKCIIVVSHSNIAKEYADVVYKLENGKLFEVSS